MATQVGIRELRGHLGHYLARAQEGQVIVVTDHGTAVARITAYEAENPLERLIAEGKVSPAKKPKCELAAPIKAAGTISDLVLAQRGDDPLFGHLQLCAPFL